ncbi:uncharacterized protein NMK_2429 [Novimethylophilus kurashikiensis]|uniref:Antitoxin n=1 Tax=Novimethylophilus kurashikiensis TaxID=1825523 RepID=A0A2R5FBA5_9PROT|nr:type II toxin-antitoxin system Phd/YefM family antitoxin [Novimethylophilus kurashikiensis]GBG14828.1 uncharacterized protein NMK_2429 [Novimethylophilus kurashikiensis]
MGSTINRMTASEFNHDLAKAKRLASDNPVVVTNRGKDEYVLLSAEYFSQLIAHYPSQQSSIVDMLRMPDIKDEIKFKPQKMTMMARPVDLDD